MKFSRALESEMRNRWRRNMMPYPGSGYVPHMGPVFACRPAPFDIVLCEENFQKTRENDDSDLTQVVFLFFSFLFLFLPFFILTQTLWLSLVSLTTSMSPFYFQSLLKIDL